MEDSRTRSEALTLLLSTCDRGHSGSCLSAALPFAPALAPRPDCQRAQAPAEKACRRRDVNACAIVDACKLAADTEASSALERLRRQCERRTALACLYWADGQTDPATNLDRIRAAYEVGCEPKSGLVASIACGRLGAIDLGRARTGDDRQRALHLLEHGCQGSSGKPAAI